MARYVVTGGCGFIGSHLVDKLIDLDHEVYVVDNLSSGKLENLNKKATFFHCDISDTDVMKGIFEECDGCFHLAAIASVEKSINSWVFSHNINLSSTIKLLNISKNINLKKRFPFIYASSAAVYGSNPDYPYTENSLISPISPISPYGIDKYSCELQANFASLQYQLPSIGLRFFNVYGKRQDPKSPYSGVISIFIEKISTEKEVCVFGDGSQFRDFIHVSDVIRHLTSSMELAVTKSMIINVCTGKSSTLHDLIKNLSLIYDLKPKVTYLEERAGDIKYSIGDNSLARRYLHIETTIDLLNGLKKTVL